MKASEALIAWTPPDVSDDFPDTAGKVKVGPLLGDGQPDWTEPYSMTGGAAHAEVQELTGAESVARVFIDFHHIVVGDGILPLVAHEAFLVIDEYREHLASDIPGAIEGDDDET